MAATPIDFDIRQLEIFCKVVDLGSFSRAAEAVFLAQASVSERIATLEKAVGTRLLDRLGRQVVPTAAGELLYKHAVLLLDMKRSAALEMARFLGRMEGEVRLGGSTIPGEYILPQVLGRFHEQFPGVTVSVQVADTRSIEQQVLEGHLELGVIGSETRHKNLLQHRLWQDELVLAVPPGHPWSLRKRIRSQDLGLEPFILREVGSGTLKIMERYLGWGAAQESAGLKVVARLGSSTAVKEGIKAGLGISILSARAIQTELRTGLLRAVRIQGIRMARSFYLIRDRRRIASPLCQTLHDFLCRSAAGEDASIGSA